MIALAIGKWFPLLFVRRLFEVACLFLMEMLFKIAKVKGRYTNWLVILNE